MSAKKGSSQKRGYKGPLVRQSFGRVSTESKIKEEDCLGDLEEEKSLIPPEVPSGTTAGGTAKYDPLDETHPAKAGHVSFINKTAYKEKEKKSKATAHKLRAPDSDGEEQEKSGAADSR